MLDRNRIIEIKRIMDEKEVDEMTKQELIELLDIVTDVLIEVYNDNIILAKTLHNIRTPLNEINLLSMDVMSTLKSCKKE